MNAIPVRGSVAAHESVKRAPPSAFLPLSFSDFPKRLADITLALAAVVLASPLLILIAVASRLHDRGTILYRAPRIGLYGAPFRMYKFRTMVPNAERLGGSSTAEGDPRITPIGVILRRFKLDELPQLFNVIRGDMSLVGPRPEVKEYTDAYSAEERVIFTVRPGLTDYASLRFRNLNALLATAADPDLYYKDRVRPEKNALRVIYVGNRSFLRDLHVMLYTIYALIFRRHGDGIPKAWLDTP